MCKHNRIKWTGTNNWEHHSWLVVRAQWFTLNYHLPVACEQALIIGVLHERLMNKEGSFKRNCGARPEGEYNKVIWYYQLS